MAGIQKILGIHGIKTEEYDIFVETGLYDGRNISSMFSSGYFNSIEKAYSIELNSNYIDLAYSNFPQLRGSNVALLHGDSGILLENILEENNEKKIILWLDAHYSGAETSKSEKFGECPILSELKSIRKLKNKPMVIIDDFGCFLPETPYYYEGWPSAEEIFTAAKESFDFDIFISDRDESNQLHYCILS